MTKGYTLKSAPCGIRQHGNTSFPATNPLLHFSVSSPSPLPIWTHAFIHLSVSAGLCWVLRPIQCWHPLINAAGSARSFSSWPVAWECVCMLVYHIHPPSGGAQWAMHKSMVMYLCGFYEALNNKKAISYDMNNPMGHHRHCKAIISALVLFLWFAEVPAVLWSFLEHKCHKVKRKIYESIYQAHPAYLVSILGGFN